MGVFRGDIASEAIVFNPQRFTGIIFSRYIVKGVTIETKIQIPTIGKKLKIKKASTFPSGWKSE